jgi:hypothetical protein
MKTKTILSIAATLTILIFITGCGKYWFRIEGNGDFTSELRTMPQFSRVVNEGEFHVFIQQDSVFEVLIEAESNLLPYIRTRVNGTTLIIDTRENLRPHHPMKLYIKTPVVEGITLSGSGFIRSEEVIFTDNLDLGLTGSGDIEFDVEGKEIKVGITGSGSADMNVYCDYLVSTISGSGNMHFVGEAERGDYRISGSGSVRAENLLLKECYALISGSGNMYVSVEDYLEAEISGSGSIFYYGDPSVSANISGSGSVIKP